MPVLPESTERLLRAMDALPAAAGLVLAGGTALALRISHRSSADLDFVFNAAHLPRRRIANLVSTLRRKYRTEVIANIAAEHDFLDAGLELADYQQDYSVDGVKVTFFVPDPPKLGGTLAGERGVVGLKRIQVATLDSLFIMKAIVLNQRITTRDLFDVYTLIEQHGYSFARVFAAAIRFNHSVDVLKARMLHAKRRNDDAGIETLTRPAPTFAHLQAYFAAAIDRIEQAQAEAAFTRKPRPARPRPRRK